jgi:hypothetical protein
VIWLTPGNAIVDGVDQHYCAVRCFAPGPAS